MAVIRPPALNRSCPSAQNLVEGVLVDLGVPVLNYLAVTHMENVRAVVREWFGRR
jgi:hypothetical protein